MNEPDEIEIPSKGKTAREAESTEPLKKRPCLRCDKVFLTTKHFRLCQGCRRVAESAYAYTAEFGPSTGIS